MNITKTWLYVAILNDIVFSFKMTSNLNPFLYHISYHNLILHDPLVAILQSSQGRIFLISQ